MRHARKTCSECPWRTDVPTGRFPPERYIQLAGTMYDMAGTVFACHKSHEDAGFACAGAIIRTGHSLILRMARIDPNTIEATGPLYPGFRAMAIANGVPARHPALRGVRDPED